MRDPLPFRPANAPDIRTQAIAQIAIALTAGRVNPGRPYREFRLSVGAPVSGAYQPALTFTSDTADAAGLVARGELDLATGNPSAYLTMAYRGIGRFTQPLPVRAIAVMPSWDRMAFAVSDRTGLTSIASIREQRYPLRVSVRANETHLTRFVVDEVLRTEGLSLRDIEAWGGSVQGAESPSAAARFTGMRDGTIDAIFDEGITVWAEEALQAGMRFLPLADPALRRMEQLGWTLGPIPRARYPQIPEDVPAVSFSGWPIFTHADLPDQVAYEICRALDTGRPFVAWDTDHQVELRDLCTSSDEAPLDVPLHPGAARYYTEHGALSPNRG